MEGVRKLRTSFRSTFTKCVNKIQAELSKDNPDTCILDGLFSLWEIKHGELSQKDQEYMEHLCQNGDEHQLEAEQDTIDEYSTTFYTIKSKVGSVKRSLVVGGGSGTQVVPSGSSVGGQVARPVPTKRYPETELRKFDGNPKNWLSFWSQFQKIDQDESLTNGDKFDYLIQSMVPDSKADKLVKNYPPCGENYQNALEALKRRFGRKLLLADVYARELVGVLKNAPTKKVPLTDLYDQLESHINTLESLGLNADSCEFCSILLYPMVESCVPEEVLKAWDRENRVLAATQADEDPTKSSVATSEFDRGRVRRLLNFLREEVEGDEGILLARGSQKVSAIPNSTKPRFNKPSNVPSYTATGLLNQNKPRPCVFCEASHKSDECTKSLTLDERYNLLREKGCCFICLIPGHSVRSCRKFVKCRHCGRRHPAILCSGASGRPQETKSGVTSANNFVVAESLANVTSHPTVALQTLRVWICGADGERRQSRAIIDTGSQKSYIRLETAKEMGYACTNKINVVHVLFGGTKTQVQTHECYSIILANHDETYQCTFEALGQPTICDSIPNLKRGHWTEVLQKKGVAVSDLDWSAGQIEILIGADIAGNLLTGNIINTGVGAVAVQTRLGWSLMGKLPELPAAQEETVSALSLLCTNPPLSDLWSLDVIGVTDPYEKKTKEELELATKEHFLKTITRDDQGRYEVSMPWLEGHPPISSNFDLASKRLDVVLKKLTRDSLTEAYSQVFQQWLQEGIIEVIDNDNRLGHYLPHRPVVKWSSTTKIRPVFDASAKDYNGVSLNSCLAKGPNLIENLTSILLRFRSKAYGVISDITKAFLQVGLKEEDRQFLKFLWRDRDGQLIVYRHARVVFGVTCSPFLLGAVIEFHLKKYLTEDDVCLNDTVETLIKGMYVDNCVVSLENEKEVENFIQSSTKIMSEAKFDLRGWEWTSPTASPSNETVNLDVLGMRWNRVEDTLSLSETCFKNISFSVVTKRTMLSLAQHVFDPLGLTTGVMLCPKILLQRTWSLKLKWDEEISGDLKKEFCQWCKELPLLLQVQIPRWVFGTHELVNASCHVFCDASKLAYAACIFLHLETAEGVSVRFVRAKSRIAPIKTMSIPRLELMGATIGARLYDATKREFPPIQDLPCYFWSDSSTVIAWIQRKESWNVFVRNRINEIRQLTNMERWSHIAGSLNPADLLSRGCSAKEFVNSKWWNGEEWMKVPLEKWPTHIAEPDENEINMEKLKSVTTMTLTTLQNDWYYKYFSKFTKIVNMLAWVKRFINNCKNEKKQLSPTLTVKEINQAEITLFKLIQKDSFSDENDSKISPLNPFKDSDGVIRIRSKIIFREDETDFLYPVVLPARHPVVSSIISHYHLESCHAGVQILFGVLRERFWIIGARRTIRSVVKKCVTCRRFDAKKLTVPAAPLPENRVRDAAAFEVTGLDLAGPLYLRDSSKVWILVLTCGVYRAVHFELLSSLNTETFILGLKRFIARRGRPSVLYSDNGTNFRGADNLFRQLDWTEINQFTNLKRIEWRFIVPAAPWWGGWWEVIVKLLKNLLRRVLGRASLTYEELLTVICDCEAVINNRPITYASEEPGLEPIRPAMFIQDVQEVGVPCCDAVETSRLTKRAKYRKNLQEQLRNRFRNEYLGALRHNAKIPSRELKVGELVLIERDNLKRLDWPLAKVLELYPGRDGEYRVARLLSVSGELRRPIQRLIPLEVQASNELGDTCDRLLPGSTSQVEVRSDHALEKTDTEDPSLPPSAPPTASSLRPRRNIRKPPRFL